MHVTPQSIGYAMDRVEYKLIQKLKQKCKEYKKSGIFFWGDAKEVKLLSTWRTDKCQCKLYKKCIGQDRFV